MIDRWILERFPGLETAVTRWIVLQFIAGPGSLVKKRTKGGLPTTDVQFLVRLFDQTINPLSEPGLPADRRPDDEEREPGTSEESEDRDHAEQGLEPEGKRQSGGGRHFLPFHLWKAALLQILHTLLFVPVFFEVVIIVFSEE